MMRFTTLLISLFCLIGQASFSQTTKEAVHQLLTGGAAFPDGKSWKFVPDPRKTGIGPLNGNFGVYYNFPEGLVGQAVENGMLNNAYTFRQDSMYIPQNQNVTAQWAHANVFFGKQQPQYSDINVVDPNHKEAPFRLRKNSLWSSSTGYEIAITDGSYLGYFENRSVYQIIAIKTDTMFVCQGFSESPSTDPALDTLARCFTFSHVPTVITDLHTEAMQGLDLSMYPNPASSLVSFSANVASYTLYNVAGKSILSGEGTTLDIAKLEPGLYTVKLTDSKGKVVYQKLLKE